MMTLQCKNSMHTNWNDIIRKKNVIDIVVSRFMHEHIFWKKYMCAKQMGNKTSYNNHRHASQAPK
jgi:hypothetical protein